MVVEAFRPCRLLPTWLSTFCLRMVRVKRGEVTAPVGKRVLPQQRRRQTADGIALCLLRSQVCVEVARMRLGERRQGGHGTQVLGRQGRKGPSTQRGGREAVRGHADAQRLESGAESRWGGGRREDSDQ